MDKVAYNTTFKGIFSRNTLRGIPKEGLSMVINLDSSAGGGAH